MTKPLKVYLTVHLIIYLTCYGKQSVKVIFSEPKLFHKNDVEAASIVCSLARETSVCRGRPCFWFTYGVMHLEVGGWAFWTWKLSGAQSKVAGLRGDNSFVVFECLDLTNNLKSWYKLWTIDRSPQWEITLSNENQRGLLASLAN